MIDNNGAVVVDTVWRGGPSRARIVAIKMLTEVQRDGVRIYRAGWAAGWRRLKTAKDYEVLNQFVDQIGGVQRDYFLQ